MRKFTENYSDNSYVNYSKSMQRSNAKAQSEYSPCAVTDT